VIYQSFGKNPSLNVCCFAIISDITLDMPGFKMVDEVFVRVQE
jgi:hypothetical protein